MPSTTKDPLDTRVEILEREVEGEKMVTRYILEQTRQNGDDLAALRTRMARVEDKVDVLDGKVDGLERKFDGLRRDLPGIVAESMREVLGESRRKKK